VFGSSAALWAQAGATSLGQWGYVTTDLLQLGYNTNVTVSGVSKKFTVAEGTSAILPAATFGVVRLLSAVGTAGLSGMVGLSGVAITVSAVGNDVMISGFNAAVSASAGWFYPGTAAAPGLMAIGDPASAGIFASAGGTLGFSTSATERMRITSAGLVGIGIANPASEFVVGRTASANFELSVGGSITMQSYNRSIFDYATMFIDGSTLQLRPLGTARAVVTSAGVGILIGAGYPKETLEVGGTFQISAVTSANLAAASGTRSGMIAVDLTASALIIYVGAARMSAAFAAF